MQAWGLCSPCPAHQSSRSPLQLVKPCGASPAPACACSLHAVRSEVHILGVSAACELPYASNVSGQRTEKADLGGVRHRDCCCVGGAVRVCGSLKLEQLSRAVHIHHQRPLYHLLWRCACERLSRSACQVALLFCQESIEVDWPSACLREAQGACTQRPEACRWFGVAGNARTSGGCSEAVCGNEHEGLAPLAAPRHPEVPVPAAATHRRRDLQRYGSIQKFCVFRSAQMA